MDQPNWYPPPDHPQHETNRIIFDNLYNLRDTMNGNNAGAPASPQGMAVTISLGKDNNNNPVFKVQGKTYTQLTFSGGLIKGVS